MSHTDGGMVFESAPGEPQEFVLQIGNLSDAAAAEISFFDRLSRKLRFAGVYFEFSVLRKAIGKSHVERRNSALVAAPAAAGVPFGEHLVLGDGSPARHQRLRDGTAMEENYFIFVLAVIVVPVQAGGRLARSEIHRPHRNGGAKIDLAGGDDAAVVELGE